MNTDVSTSISQLAESPLTALKTLDEIQLRAPHIFPSVESLRWFIRQHRSRLQPAGALLFIRGRLMIDPIAFDQIVLLVGREASKRP